MAEQFEECDLAGAIFHSVNLRGARFDDVNLEKATIRNANLAEMEIDDANIAGLTIFSIRIDQLLSAEFDRRDPERVRLRMTDPHDLAEVRAAFRDELRACDPQLLSKQPVPDQWSVIEIVRHMLYAEDWYLNRWIAANDALLHPAGLLPAFTQQAGEFASVGSEPPQDIAAALAAWAEVNARTHAFAAQLTPEDLRRSSDYPEARNRTAGQVLQQLAGHDLDHIRQAQKALSVLQGEH